MKRNHSNKLLCRPVLVIILITSGVRVGKVWKDHNLSIFDFWRTI